ncbi:MULTISPECIES: hypothetical protein [unclassified Egicoccus]|uniref:hypothetical protein n=1 Tax=unclassified Egicoccus TaxID=2635606 RepID=UPI00359CDDD5
MAETPTYGWPTPDDTDLVREGAAAIRDLADAIDVTLDGEADARAAAVAALDKLTTKGDLLVHTGGGYVRLPAGVDEQALVVDSAAEVGVRWAAPAGGGDVAVGTYVGDGTNGRLIVLPFDPVQVTVMGVSSRRWAQAVVGAGGTSVIGQSTSHGAQTAAGVLDCAANGFEVHNFTSNNGVYNANQSGETYSYVAIGA